MSHENHSHAEGHHISVTTYIIILLALFGLTGLTVYTAQQVDLGGTLNLVLAMVIASTKATIVALYFMHLKFEDKLTWVYALYPLFLLFLLIFFTMVETFTRVPVLK